MVKRESLKHAVLIVLFLASSLCYSSPQLVLISDKSESEIGRPVRIELYAVDIESKLNNIDLSPLSKDFGLVTEYSIDKTSDSRWPNQSIQILNFKIYPRRTGKLTIPALRLNKYSSKEKSIIIERGTSGSEPAISISTNSPYNRQQFIILFSLYSKHLSSRLTIKADEKIYGFQSTVLNFNRTRQKDGSYLLTTGWAVSALGDGQHELTLPAIDYSVSGVSRKKFYLPKQRIEVKKLPSYLAPTIPVGEVTIHSKLPETNLFKTDTLFNWQIKLRGNLSNSYQLPPILRQVKTSKDIKIFPVNTQREQEVNTKEVISTVTHSIPLKILRSGYVSLPTIKTQYFDPVSGKLINVQLQSQHVLAANSYLQLLVYLVTFLLVVYIAYKLYKLWRKLLFIKTKRKSAIELLKNNASTDTIREAIRLISVAEGWPVNVPLTHWKELWSEKYQADSEFLVLFQKISHSVYAKEKNDPEEIKSVALSLIKLLENRKHNKRTYNIEIPTFNL